MTINLTKKDILVHTLGNGIPLTSQQLEKNILEYMDLGILIPTHLHTSDIHVTFKILTKVQHTRHDGNIQLLNPNDLLPVYIHPHMISNVHHKYQEIKQQHLDN